MPTSTVTYAPRPWPARSGPRPRTTAVNPHQQLDQNAPPDLQEELVHRVSLFPGVELGESWISVPGSRAFLLDRALAGEDGEAFFGPTTEFAHVHPPRDGSLHAKLPQGTAAAVVAAGWGEPHPMALRRGPPVTNILLYGPRDAAELATILAIVRRSYLFARGRPENVLDALADRRLDALADRRAVSPAPGHELRELA